MRTLLLIHDGWEHERFAVHMIFINFYTSNFAPEWLKAELPEPHATLALVLCHACPEVSQETYYKRHTSGSSHYVF